MRGDEDDSGDDWDELKRNEKEREKGQAIFFIAGSGQFVNTRLARLSTARGLSMSTCHGVMSSLC